MQPLPCPSRAPRSDVSARRLWNAQKLRLILTVGAGDLAGVGCMVLPVWALARLPAFNVGQDGGVLEARVHAVVQKGHSVAAVVHVLVPAHLINIIAITATAISLRFALMQCEKSGYTINCNVGAPAKNKRTVSNFFQM